MSKKKTPSRSTSLKTPSLPLKTSASRKKKSTFNQAKETQQFFTILLVGTFLLVFFLYLIFMKTAR